MADDLEEANGRLDKILDEETPSPVEAIKVLMQGVEGKRLCNQGYHAWTPWLAVHYPPDVRGGAVSFYITWCARKDCDHTEQWDCP